MNLNHLYYFRVLAEMEHYTQAANKLSITQPSLSHAISMLERDLGTYLFEKQGRNIKLTKYGRLFLEYVNSGLSELEIGEKKLRGLISETSGFIDLAYIYTLGSNFVPSIIKNFLSNDDYKNISFSFNQGNTKNIINGLKNEKFDLAFCSFIENEDDIEFIPIGRQDLVLIVSKDHPLASYDSIDLKDTKDYPFVFFNKESGIRPIIDSLFAKADITPNIICEVEEDHSVAGLVSINYGIAVMPKIYTLNSFDVKVLEIKNPLYERNVYMASLKNTYMPPSVKMFKNFIIDNYKI